MLKADHTVPVDQDLNNGGPLFVSTTHMQVKDTPLPLRKEKPIPAGMGIGSPPELLMIPESESDSGIRIGIKAWFVRIGI